MLLVEASVFDGTRIDYSFESFVKAHIFIKEMEQNAIIRNVSFDYKIKEQ